jgi:hypothetical protein
VLIAAPGQIDFYRNFLERARLQAAADGGTFAWRSMLDATERRTLITTTFTAACICFAPAQIISGVVLLFAALVLYLWDQRMLRREAAVTAPGTPEPPAPSDPGPEAGAGAG